MPGFSVAPFLVLNDRERDRVKNLNPGPGSYAAENLKLVKTPAENPSNSFITKIDRFAPTAPGSSVFKQSTYVDNPGPGTYTISAMKPQRPKSADNSS